MSAFAIIKRLVNRGSTRWLANASVAPEPEMILSNEGAVHGEDGWVQLSPYGDFDNSGGMQIIRQADAQAIVENFQALANTVQRSVGLPWYIGHPDHPSGKDRYLDTRAYGRVKDLAARDDGLYGLVKWSTKGKALVNEAAFHGHSTNWKVRKDGNAWRPFMLKSVGFTNEPNIPVRPILVANEKPNENTMLKKLIDLMKLKQDATEADAEAAISALVNEKSAVPAWLLKLMGKPSATEAEATTFINEAMEQKNPLDSCNEELATFKRTHKANELALTEAKDKIVLLTNERDGLKLKIVEVETNFANERKARIVQVLDGAITAGKITAAERPNWERDLVNEFAGNVEKLSKLKPTLNTQSIVGSAAERHPQVLDRNKKVTELINAKMEGKEKLSYDAAWARVNEENPALFSQMTVPAHVKRQ